MADKAGADIADDLFAAAERHAAGMGRRLGDGADDHLRDMTKRAGRLLAELPDGERAPALRQAHADLFALLDDAVDEGARLPDYPSDLLGELSYFPALGRFCPRFPFC